MSPRKTWRIAIPAILALPALTPLVIAQRAAETATPVQTRQSPELKTPAQPVAPRELQVRNNDRPLVRSGASVQQPAKIEGLDRPKASPRVPHDQLYFSDQEDGSPQVHGRTFKAEFTPGGATYIPFCGSAAPQNHPLTFRIDSIRAGNEPVGFSDSVVATRDGQTVSYARGSVTESYALGVDSVEQKFVFSSLPANGDLELRLGVTSDMTASFDGAALLFSSADGTVRYGAATVLDASGSSAPVQTELDGGAIVLRVPASFLATAVFPVTIDPVISTFSVSWQGLAYDDFAPSIAWDESYQIYCIVFEEVFSATDHDVIFTFEDAAGNPVWAGYTDTGLSDYWANPDVANNNQYDNFFVVAEVGLPGGGARAIHGRTLDANTAALGADVLVSTTDVGGEKINATIGGDPFGSGTVNYAVAWQRIFSAGFDDDIHYRYVTPAGVLVGAGTGMIDNSGSTLDRHPRISKSCGGGGVHHVVWQREVSPTNHDVYAAELDYQGNITIGSTAVVNGGGSETAPAASTRLDASGQWLLVWEYDYISDRDIYASLMTGVTASPAIDLSYVESSYRYGTGTYLQDQRHPAADSDGARFAVAYSESYASSATDYDMYVSTLDVINGLLELSEFHRNIAFSTTHEDYPRMCSTAGAGGGSWRTATVWSDTGGANQGDVEAALYDVDDATKFCFPTLDGVGGCPCGNNPYIYGTGCYNSSSLPASIWQTGTASISSDSAVLYTYDEKPTALSIVTQGSALVAAGVNFGQGKRCAGGTLKRLYLKAAIGGSITAPTGADPSIHARSAALGDPLSAGAFRYYYVYYRDPIVLGGCSATLTFNATDTVQMLWRP
jgi:hypothetical protein